MAKHNTETVTWVHHWNPELFSFRTTRSDSLRFRNGEFIMIGLEDEPRPIMRAYSIASANHEEYLEFFSIKVPGGKLTSKLQHLQVGQSVLIGSKPTGTLVLDDLKPGKHLYLLGTGTGLAPFLSIIQGPETYEKFEKVVLFHGVRTISELAYRHWLESELPRHEYLGDMVRQQLLYFPSVTRENFFHQGRITDWLIDNRLPQALELPDFNPAVDRVMLCGSPSMLKDSAAALDALGFVVSPKTGETGDYVIERAFVES